MTPTQSKILSHNNVPVVSAFKSAFAWSTMQSPLGVSLRSSLSGGVGGSGGVIVGGSGVGGFSAPSTIGGNHSNTATITTTNINTSVDDNVLAEVAGGVGVVASSD